MNFKTEYGEFELSKTLRTQLKPDWKATRFPAKDRPINVQMYARIPFLISAEHRLAELDISLCGKDILEFGCGYGELAHLMAKYEGTTVHAIDVDEYIADQAPDLNSWNPKDLEFVNNKWTEVRNTLASKLPKSVTDKVTFGTCGMEAYATPNPHDIIISWDTLEHIVNLPMAFTQMANSVKKGGIVYSEYNPFFSLTGGHSLCTLDFLFGHCQLNNDDFERYIREVRPEEEKQALNFYHKCLNRFTQAQIKNLALKNGFEILKFEGGSTIDFKKVPEDILKNVQKHYPSVTEVDLLHDSVHLILRRV